jgi:hypothetical protein
MLKQVSILAIATCIPSDIRKPFVGLVGATLISLVASNPLYACACCTDFGQRTVMVRQLDSYSLNTVRRLRFSKRAELFVDDRGVEGIKGISGLSESGSGIFDLVVSQQRDRWLFEFRYAERRHADT